MSRPTPTIDQVLIHNQKYGEGFTMANMPAPPSRKLAMVGCMDARINPVTSLGLAYGEAHILRNAGGVVTPDVHRSLIVSTQKLGTREIMIVNHTKCGMINLDGDVFRAELRKKYGPHPYGPTEFYGFDDLAQNIQYQLKIVRNCPWIHPDAIARGFVYDVDTGLLTEVH